MEYFITNFFFGVALGFIGLLLPNLRTIKMLEGLYIQVFFIHILAAIMTIVFTMLVAQGVIPFMIGNTIGGAMSISVLAYKRRKQ